MRAEVAEADRRQEVRAAAHAWQRAGAVSEETVAAIGALYPDDRSRLGPVFRVLVFGFTVVIVSSLFGLFGLVLAGALGEAAWALMLFFGVVLLGATELQMGALRRREGGTESATAAMALGYLVGGSLWFVFEVAHPGPDASIDIGLMVVVLLCGVAGAWWGYEIFVAFAGVAAYVLLARGPFGRLAWMIGPLVLAPLLVRAGEAPRLAPAHRRSCQVLAALSLVFLYLAVHLGSWDGQIVESIRTGRWWDSGRDSGLRPFFVVATAVVPLVTLAWAIVTRRRLLLNLGILGLLASLVTLRFYVHLAPRWVVLLAGGGAAIGLALALRRFLDSGPAHERHGFTAEPVFTDPDRRHALEVAAGVVSFAPGARPAEQPGFKGGGGRSGGAGSTGEF